MKFKVKPSSVPVQSSLCRTCRAQRFSHDAAQKYSTTESLNSTEGNSPNQVARMGSLVCVIVVHLAKAGFSQHCSFLKSLIKMSRIVIKQDFCICKNKDADQLRRNGEADQRLCFRYKDSTIPLLPKCEMSSL